MTFSPLAAMLGLVIAQRLYELWVARRNTRNLMARGGVEIGARHYPLFVVLHVSWLAAIALLVPYDRTPNMVLIGIYLLLQLGRIWVMATLGAYWTTRIIHVPDAPLVRRGPFRFVKHPNYLIVASEIAVLPLAFGAWRIALVFSLLSAVLTLYRIKVEETGLAQRA